MRLEGSLLFTSVSDFHAVSGKKILLIDNRGTNPVDGEFLDLPEGSLLDFGGDTDFLLTYFGGDGNDVELMPFVVFTTTTADAGVGSFRQAIHDTQRFPQSAVRTPEIRFEIPGAGPRVIQVLSALPSIEHPVRIIGSQPPASSISP